jgi:3'-phosphoadenosine 5'-phosphosulfate sulfotransferase (PAPS reductase)/FAD synthetase
MSDVTHVVAISGGKDSTALALRLAEVEPRNYLFVITPTGDELPYMEAHWSKLEALLGAPFIRVSGGTLKDLVLKNRMIPNFRARFCTPSLKLRPYQYWLRDRLPAVTYVGLRADEPDREGAIYYGLEGLTVRYPLREWGWGEADVLAYLASRGVEIPQRTDCARCFFQTLYEWYLLWRDFPAIYEDACLEEDAIGHTYRSDGRDSHPAALRGLAAEFAAGYIPKERSLKRSTACSFCSR